MLASESDRQVYLQLLRHYCGLHQLVVMGYCLMSNHVHLVVMPKRKDSLALAMKYAHGQYATHWNAAHASSGHVWQGRPYSCPLDTAHLWSALRYTELNPVRAGMVSAAEEYPWSSAAAHCGTAAPDECLEMDWWREQWTAESWREHLRAGETEEEREAIRRCTHTGRPLGTEEFTGWLEEHTQRLLRPQKGGRPKKLIDDRQQKLPL